MVITTQSDAQSVGDESLLNGREALSRAAFSGVRWSVVATYGSQALQFVISIVLARLLVPEDFGLMAMAFVFVGFLDVFRTLGFGQAVIQSREISDALTSSLFFVNIAAACLMALVAAASAPVVAWIYGDPRITPIMAVLSITFLLSAPAIMPGAMLTREMAFNRLAVVQILSTIVRGASAISLALLGCGVWSLVWSALIGSATGTALFHVLSPWRPRLSFRWSEVRSVFSFGANLTGFQVFNYFARNADNFIIAALLGAAPLGYYSLAYGILLRPQQAISRILTRVLFPAFSRMQDDNARLKAAYLRACSAVALVSFPMMLGLLVVTRPLVDVLLGAKWLAAVPLICILAPVGMVQSIVTMNGQLYLAKGRTDLQFRVGGCIGIAITVSFLIGVSWGVLGVAVAYAMASLLLTYPSLRFAYSVVPGLQVRDLMKVLTPYAVSAGTMALLVFVCRLALESARMNGMVVLLVCIPLGAATYTAIVLCTRPPALQDFARLVPDRWTAAFRRLAANRTR